MKLFVLMAVLSAVPLAAQDQQSPGALDQVVPKIIARESQEMEIIRGYSPLVETYIQKVSTNKNNRDSETSWEPNGDHYFIGRAELSKGTNLERIDPRDEGSVRHVFVNLSQVFSFGVEFLPQGFLQMIYPDPQGLDATKYKFEYVRREFLGDVRTLVFDVTPPKKGAKGRFVGRIWVEDEDFTIVRFNGGYSGNANANLKFHFDSWRMNIGPNLWLPAVIYSEEITSKHILTQSVTSKAQTRLWGYNIGHVRAEQELGKILIESQQPVIDKSQQNTDLSPLQQKRAWDLQAQENILERLQRQGLLAPKGEVDKILETVVNNLEVTNNLNFEPEIRCRVLMSSTLESFSFGRTIVLSRGLIDVLPDEASLAAMIAKELGHLIANNQETDTRYAFFDRVIQFDEKATFQHFDFTRTHEDDAAAGAKAAELLRNSPYKNQLRTAEIFIAELQKRSREIPNLISPRLGDSVLVNPSVPPDTEDKQNPNQVVALPLGGRIKVDPWDDTLVMIKAQTAGTITNRDKLPFEITPFVLYLTRVGREGLKTSQYNGVSPDQPSSNE